jgi:Plasmid stabilization system protein
MTYRIEMTKQAQSGLREIFEHIAFVLKSPQYALQQVERIEAQIQKLNHLPERFRIYEKEPWKSRKLRQVAVDNFIIFYFVGKEVVTIIRIMYGGRDIDEQLR